jgi:hypothetical protein
MTTIATTIIMMDTMEITITMMEDTMEVEITIMAADTAAGITKT